MFEHDVHGWFECGSRGRGLGVRLLHTQFERYFEEMTIWRALKLTT